MGNLENLTAEDLMYMIYNRNNFSLTTSSFIHFNENEWLNKIEKELSSDTINDIKDKTKNVNKLCEEIKDSLKLGLKVTKSVVKVFNNSILLGEVLPSINILI